MAASGAGAAQPKILPQQTLREALADAARLRERVARQRDTINEQNETIEWFGERMASMGAKVAKKLASAKAAFLNARAKPPVPVAKKAPLPKEAPPPVVQKATVPRKAPPPVAKPPPPVPEKAPPPVPKKVAAQRGIWSPSPRRAKRPLPRPVPKVPSVASGAPGAASGACGTGLEKAPKQSFWWQASLVESLGDVFGDLPPPLSRNAAGHVIQPNPPSVIPMGPAPAVPQQPDSP